MDVTTYMLIVAGVFIPLLAFGAFMAHRERLEDEALEDEERAKRTPAE